MSSDNGHCSSIFVEITEMTRIADASTNAMRIWFRRHLKSSAFNPPARARTDNVHKAPKTRPDAA